MYTQAWACTHTHTHMHICSGISLSSDCFPYPYNLEASTASEMSARHLVVSGWNGFTKCDVNDGDTDSYQNTGCPSSSIACLRWLQGPVTKYFTTAMNGNGLLWSETPFRTQCGILHTNVHSCFKETRSNIFNADVMLIVAAWWF
jgi:hypothetical protein